MATRSARQRFTIHFVGGDEGRESHEIVTAYSDLMMAERACIQSGLSADPSKNPMQYTNALLWAACVRLGLTGAKLPEFADLVEDFDETKTEAPDADPTRPEAPTGGDSNSPESSAEAPTTG